MKKKERVSIYSPRSEAVSNSTAQNGTLCSVISPDELLGSQTMAKIEMLRSRSFDIYVFACLQFRNALRVSELLNCQAKDVDTLGRLKVSALKGSNDRVVDLAEFKDYVKSLAAQGVVPWSRMNRYYINREYLRVGLQLTVQGGVKRSVTHSLRHISAQLLGDKTEGLTFAQSLLGHKDKKNSEIYVKKKSASLLAQERSSGTKKSPETANSATKERSGGNPASLSKSKAKKA